MSRSPNPQSIMTFSPSIGLGVAGRQARSEEDENQIHRFAQDDTLDFGYRKADVGYIRRRDADRGARRQKQDPELVLERSEGATPQDDTPKVESEKLEREARNLPSSSGATAE